jgi:putative DNA primase/helicase
MSDLREQEAAFRERARNNGKVETSSYLRDFDDIVAKPIRWAWRDRVALAKITAIAGRPKIGKGLLYSHLIAQVTRGELPGDLGEARNAILVTTEDEPGDTLKPRLMAAGADLSRVSLFQMGSKDEPVPFRVPQDAAELGRRVAEKDAALVVVDPLMEFIDGKVDSHKSHPVRQAVASLNQIARDHGCAALVVLHLNKGTSTDPLLRHEGSAAFTQVGRGGLMLGHDPDDPDGDDGRQRVLAVSSSNLAAIAPSLVYRIDTARVVGDTDEEITTANMVHIGESGVGAHDLLGSMSGEQRTVTDEAATFLRTELAGGPRLASEIKSEARKLGLSDMALFRARQTLAVKASKTGFKGGWEWALPEDFKASTDEVKSSEVKSSSKLTPGAGLRLVEAPEDFTPSNVKSSPPRCSCLRPDPGLDGLCQRCFGVAPGGAS